MTEIYQEPLHHLVYINPFAAALIREGGYINHTLEKMFGTSVWCRLGIGLSQLPANITRMAESNEDAVRLGMSYGDIKVMEMSQGIFINPALWGLIQNFSAFSTEIYKIGDGVLNFEYVDIPYRVYKKALKQAGNLIGAEKKTMRTIPKLWSAS